MEERTFKQRLIKLAARHESPTPQDELLRKGIRKSVNGSIESYEESLNRTCASIAKYSYGQVIRTMNKISRRSARKNKEKKEDATTK